MLPSNMSAFLRYLVFLLSFGEPTRDFVPIASASFVSESYSYPSALPQRRREKALSFRPLIIRQLLFTASSSPAGQNFAIALTL